MSTFEKAIPLVLKHEGGLVDHPNDPGGITNYGVSLRFLRTVPIQDGDFDGDNDIDAEDIKNMSVEDAKSIYKKYWWDKYKYSRIVDQTIATKVLDLSVNMGASRAHKLLQTAMNNTFNMRLSVDGILGNASFSALNAIADGDEEQQLITAYCDEAYGFYQRLIASNPKNKVFERGWKNRAYSISRANSV